MRTAVFLMLLVASMMLAGCAANLDVVRAHNTGRVDPISIQNYAQFDRDFAECNRYAADWLTRAQNEAAGRAFLGMFMGAAAGAATGGIIAGGDGAAWGAGIGAATGGLAGAASTPVYADQVFGNCMVNRGYQLLW